MKTENELSSATTVGTRSDSAGCAAARPGDARAAAAQASDVHPSRPTALPSGQGRALLGALALFALLSGEPHPPQSAANGPAVGADLQSGSVSADLRPWLVSQLQLRNPRLGTSRSERIANAVVRCTERQGIEELTPELMLAVMLRESDARPGVTSAKGAVGLMQVMPYVYYDLLELPGSIGHLESNVEAGCLVLADNIRRLGLRAGVSSYFWGNAIVSDTYVKGVETILRDLEQRRLHRADSRG